MTTYQSSIYQPLYDGYNLIVNENHYICYINIEKNMFYDIIKNNLISYNQDIEFMFKLYIKSYYDIVFLNKKEETIIKNFINQYETIMSQFNLFPSYPPNSTRKLKELIVNIFYFIYENYLKNL